MTTPKCPDCGCEIYVTLENFLVGNTSVLFLKCVRCGKKYKWKQTEKKKEKKEHRFNIKINLDFLSPIKNLLGFGGKK